MPDGAKLFMYNKDKSHLIGAFTSNNNNKRKVLPVIPVKGDQITIEYFEPKYPKVEGVLKIGKISHDFLNFYENEMIFLNSNGCTIDINCTEGENWQNEKRAVCKILAGGGNICSGALINNTNNNGTPYVLTANHCISTQINAESSVFIFNYERPTCNGTSGSQAQSISGSELKATLSTSDFTLLELYKLPLSTFSPYYAGWDNRNIVKNNVVGIHHPNGNEKEICFDNDNIQSTFYPSHSVDPNANHWKVIWDEGVTADMSSGSPLFDNNARIIGQLHGGYSECVGEETNGLADWYGKFSTSWDEGSNALSRLRDWLNPQNNVFILDGINGCDEGIAVNLNITHTITSTELHQATNNITASNIIETGATATYEAGNQIKLLPGFRAKSGSNFVARIEDFNCVVTCDPINLSAWTNFVCTSSNLCYNIVNSKHYEIIVRTQSGALVYQGSGNTNGSTTCVWNTLGVSSGYYIVTVGFDNDCHTISNTYQVLVASCKTSDSENYILEMEEESNETTSLIDEQLQSRFNLSDNIKLHPNPTTGQLFIILPDSFENYLHLTEVFVTDILGKTIYKATAKSTNMSFDLSSNSKGSYIIRVQTKDEIVTKKNYFKIVYCCNEYRNILKKLLL